MTNTITLLDLLEVVNEHSRTEAEAIATVVHLVNSGAVRLGGNFRGAHFDLGSGGDQAPIAA